MAEYIVANSMEDPDGYYYPPTILNVEVEANEGVYFIKSSLGDESEKDVDIFTFMAAILATKEVRNAMNNSISVAEAEMQRRTYRLINRGDERIIRQYWFHDISDDKRKIAYKLIDLMSYNEKYMTVLVWRDGLNLYADELVEILVAIRAGYIPVPEKLKTFLFAPTWELRSSRYFKEYLDAKYNENLEKERLTKFKVEFSEAELSDRKKFFDFTFIRNRE